MEPSVTFTKIVSTLIYPLNIALCLLVISLLLQIANKRRLAVIVSIMAIAPLWALSTPLISSSLVKGLESLYPPQPIENMPNSDALVLLGGGIGISLPPRLYPDLGGSADRTYHTAQLYKAGKANAVIVSAGNVFKQDSMLSEAQYTQQLLMEWGVPKSAIILEEKSRNTYQNALGVKSIIEERNFTKITLVTSAFHMKRAMANFHSLGLLPVPAPTDFRGVNYKRPKLLSWLPNTGALSQSTMIIKEHIGFWYYKTRNYMTENLTD